MEKKNQLIWYERRVCMYQRAKFPEQPWEGNQAVLEWNWCNYERNLISWMLQLAGKWSYWLKHSLMDLFVSVTLRILLMQMEYLKGASDLNSHCNTTWEKFLSLGPAKDTPKLISTTKTLLHQTLLGLWPSLDWVSLVLPSTGALRVGDGMQTGNVDPWHWTQGGHGFRALCFSKRTATVSFPSTTASQPLLEQKPWAEE